MKYPIISKKTKPFFPTEEICPICQTNRTTLNSEFYALAGGALKKISKSTSMPSKKLKGFLSVIYHAGENSENDGFKIDIIDESQDGQFDVYFCSTNCMRQFLNELVDNIEEQLQIK